MAKQKLKAENNTFLFLYHFRKVFEQAIKIAGLKGGEHCLDFGCGNQNLRVFVHSKQCSYVGYDVDPERSDIKNMKEAKDINTIFTCSVLEHLTAKEMQKTFKQFKATGAKKLIVSLPADNLLNRFICFIRKDDELTFWYHLTPSKEVNTELYKAFGSPYAVKRVDGIKHIAGFNIKQKEVKT